MARAKGYANAKGLQFGCAWVLHEGLRMPVLLYGSETDMERYNERYRIRPVQMDNLRGLLGIRRMNRVPNIRIRELVGRPRKR